MSFNYRMVTLARDAAGLTQTSLAHLVGISQAFISKAENGFEEPTDDLLAKIAQACDVPVEFFNQPDQILGEGLVDMYHRKRMTLPVKPLRKANADANKCRLEALRLLRTVDFDNAQPFPDFPIEEVGSPEEAAAAVRALWRVPSGPLPDLVALIEAAGVPVYLRDLGHDKLFAMSMPGAAARHVVVLNRRQAASVQRFALAHELGHLTMHMGVSDQERESEADRFAAALLMPADDVRRDLVNLRFNMLGGLKRKWRAPMSAIVRRAHDLGLIDDGRYRNLNIELSKLPGGRKNEPGEFEREEPRLMRHILTQFETDFGYTRPELEELLVVTPRQYATGYMGEQEKPRPIKIERHLRTVTFG